MTNLGVPCAERLYSLCIKAVINQLAAICDTKPTPIPRTISKLPVEVDVDNYVEIDLYNFKDKTIKLNEQISHDLLTQLCQTGSLSNLSIGIFSNSQTNLRNVIFKGATLSLQVLQYILLQHNIVQFTVESMKLESINQVLDCLNEWSWANLKSLTISHCKWGSETLNKLERFVQVRNLNMSYTMLSSEQLDTITRLLPNLETLDISCTFVDDAAPLRRLSDKLRHLKMFNMPKMHRDKIIEPVCSLKRLQKLDLSSYNFRNIGVAEQHQEGFDANLFLESLAKAGMDELTYLDISAWVDVKEEYV